MSHKGILRWFVTPYREIQKVGMKIKEYDISWYYSIFHMIRYLQWSNLRDEVGVQKSNDANGNFWLWTIQAMHPTEIVSASKEKVFPKGCNWLVSEDSRLVFPLRFPFFYLSINFRGYVFNPLWFWMALLNANLMIQYNKHAEFLGGK